MDKAYTPGVFAKEGKNPAFINIAVKLDEFKKYINSLVAGSNGFVNFTMSKQKTNPSKYSMWLDTWKPDSTKKGTYTKSEGTDDESDNLPF